MPANQRQTLGLCQHTSKRAGLPESASHGSVAQQKVRDFGAREPREDLVPFLKGGADRAAIPAHPSFEVSAGKSEHTGIAAKSSGDPAILRRVNAIDHRMRELSVHLATVRRSVSFGEPFRQALEGRAWAS